MSQRSDASLGETAPVGETSTPIPTLPVLAVIPPRVNCRIPLRIAASGVQSGSHGVFAEEAIKEGKLIFSIKQPFFTLIEEVDGSLGHSCDHCLATKFSLDCYYRSMQLRTNARTGADIVIPIFSACKGCNIVYYCNKDCQTTAWTHYHKFECKAFRNLSEMMHPIDKGTDSLNVSLSLFARFATRLLSLEKCGSLEPVYSWDEFMKLQKEKCPDGPLFTNCAIRKTAKLLILASGSKSKEEEIHSVLHAYHRNIRSLRTPLLKGGIKWFNPHIDMLASPGVFIDPFVSAIRYACDSNVFTVFEGNELRVRALRPIAVGDELLECFTHDRSDYYQRRQSIELWNITDCKCSFCSQGPQGPHGALRIQARNLIAAETSTNSAEIQQTISDIKGAGFTESGHLMRGLHQALLRNYWVQNDMGNVLKTCFKLYYVIEPGLIPNLLPTQRLDTLHVLISFENLCVKSIVTGKKHPGIPLSMKQVLFYVHAHHDMQLASGTKKWLGSNSAAYKCEKRILETNAAYQRAEAAKMGKIYRPRPLKDEDEHALCMRHFDKLCEWAGIPAMTFEQLVEFPYK